MNKGSTIMSTTDAEEREGGYEAKRRCKNADDVNDLESSRKPPEVHTLVKAQSTPWLRTL
jgi:hypothetical protein